jgi:hypothetical protein
MTLTDAALRHTLSSTLDTLPVDPRLSLDDLRTAREAAAAQLATLAPRNATEAMFASQAVAAHHAAMECFRRAAAPDVSDETGMRLLSRAAALSRLAAAMIQALEQRQAKTTAAGAPASQATPAAEMWRQQPMPSEREVTRTEPPVSTPPRTGAQHPVSSENRPLRPASAAAAGVPPASVGASRTAAASPVTHPGIMVAAK